MFAQVPGDSRIAEGARFRILRSLRGEELPIWRGRIGAYGRDVLAPFAGRRFLGAPQLGRRQKELVNAGAVSPQAARRKRSKEQRAKSKEQSHRESPAYLLLPAAVTRRHLTGGVWMSAAMWARGGRLCRVVVGHTSGMRPGTRRRRTIGRDRESSGAVTITIPHADDCQGDCCEQGGLSKDPSSCNV